MRRFLAGFLLTLVTLSVQASIPQRGVLEVGDAVPDMCWRDVNENNVCLDQFKSNVRVLIYSTGWCPACNDEMRELAARAKEFDGEPVTFFSLSAQGDGHGSLPTTEFLKSWRDRHRIPFLVAAAPKDAGKSFFTPPLYIPNVVVIGKTGKLLFKAVAPEVDALFAEVRKGLRN